MHSNIQMSVLPNRMSRAVWDIVMYQVHSDISASTSIHNYLNISFYIGLYSAVPVYVFCNAVCSYSGLLKRSVDQMHGHGRGSKHA
jgi:hypothetical protein